MGTINSGVFDICDTACIEFVERYKSKRKFVADLKRSFSSVRAYHGTNLNDSEYANILKYGLRKTTMELLKQKALERFIAYEDSLEVKNAITKIITDHFEKESPITIGEVNFSADEQLVYEHYHYLLFGSESLLILADKLREALNLPFRSRMMEFGKHTIVVVDLPVKKVGNLWLTCIYEYINGGFPALRSLSFAANAAHAARRRLQSYLSAGKLRRGGVRSPDRFGERAEVWVI